ncbi:MAG: ABC transporter permease [Devosia sp.]|jgi:peptide/nickel transport system permease protein|uniref:ABC transporter permease n=1 Tax=unclassified Devosia TaxID=196773 RepID=UPI0009271075|nr:MULTISPECIES: ABC transporter permease [unclassified Devosia]MBL8599853.1 ABC transporter permease [Devosia sp.]MBN9347692.1 ABC transporter permease [Devosia sp.]OJX47529.1 MAG: peptide ABC transporter permease [Devosia sp. 66-22]
MFETLKVFLRNRKALTGLIIVLVYVAVAVFGPLLLNVDPMDRVGRPHQPPSPDELLGTTRMGRDVFAQVIYGTRTSLAVGFFAGTIIVLIGTFLGIAAGYFGGWFDEVITFFTNVVLVIPQLPLLLVIAAFMGQTSPLVIAIIIGLTSWAWGARVTRSQTLTLRNREYILASELTGERPARMIFVELLPNLLSIIGFNFIGSVTYTIITQATLEFLGLGNPMSVSWGTMLYHAQNTSAITIGAWWEVLVPAVAVAGIGVGLSLLNFGVDEISNPRLRTLGTVAAAVRAQQKLDRQRLAETRA